MTHYNKYQVKEFLKCVRCFLKILMKWLSCVIKEKTAIGYKDLQIILFLFCIRLLIICLIYIKVPQQKQWII